MTAYLAHTLSTCWWGCKGKQCQNPCSSQDKQHILLSLVLWARRVTAWGSQLCQPTLTALHCLLGLVCGNGFQDDGSIPYPRTEVPFTPIAPHTLCLPENSSCIKWFLVLADTRMATFSGALRKQGFSSASPYLPFLPAVTGTATQGRWVTEVFPNTWPDAPRALGGHVDYKPVKHRLYPLRVAFLLHPSLQLSYPCSLSSLSFSPCFAPYAGRWHFSLIIEIFPSYFHHKFQATLSSSAFHYLLYFLFQEEKARSTSIPIIYM